MSDIEFHKAEFERLVNSIELDLDTTKSASSLQSDDKERLSRLAEVIIYHANGAYDELPYIDTKTGEFSMPDALMDQPASALRIAARVYALIGDFEKAVRYVDLLLDQQIEYAEPDAFIAKNYVVAASVFTDLELAHAGRAWYDKASPLIKNSDDAFVKKTWKRLKNYYA